MVTRIRAVRACVCPSSVRPGGRQSYFQVYFQDHKGDTPPITEQMKNAQLKTRRVIEALEDSGWSTVEDVSKP